MSPRPTDPAGAWLVRGADVLAALGDGDGVSLVQGRPGGPAAVLRRATLVHSLRCDGLDLAWCRPLDGAPPPAAPGASWEVTRTRALPGRRAVLARPGRGAVVVAPAGAFERWSLGVGDLVGVAGS